MTSIHLDKEGHRNNQFSTHKIPLLYKSLWIKNI